LRDSAAVGYFVTSFATPSGEDPKEWAISKMKGLSVGMAALGLTLGATDILKEGTGRTRPDASDDRSLPSGHASAAGAFTTLARRNVHTLSLPPITDKIANFSLVGIAAGTAWARIEAGEHYPSDVLVGYALGHFFSAFIQDAFLGLDTKEGPFITVTPSKKGIALGLYGTY
jgi:membrane-associated phospholipid phosphatase